MTLEELARQRIRDAVEALKTQWAAETITHALDEEGDKLRRLAATKARVADQIVIQLEKAIMS